MMSVAGCASVRPASIKNPCCLPVGANIGVLWFADLRTEHCYLTHEDERCGAPISGRHRVDACCCSVGMAWGPECDECPERGTPEYDQLCPRGPGFSHRGDFLNGRPFLKGTASAGQERARGSVSCWFSSALFYRRHKRVQDDKHSLLKRTMQKYHRQFPLSL